jgi:hypothetical protein
MSKNLVEAERPPTIWRVRVACWISKATRPQAHARAHTLTPTQKHARTRVHLPVRVHTLRNI